MLTTECDFKARRRALSKITISAKTTGQGPEEITRPIRVISFIVGLSGDYGEEAPCAYACMLKTTIVAQTTRHVQST